MSRICKEEELLFPGFVKETSPNARYVERIGIDVFGDITYN